MSKVSVEGGGLAVCAFASLLGRSGIHIERNVVARGNSPVLLLSQQTRKLLSDIFQLDDLFAGAPTISKRVIAWGGKTEMFSHSGIVISEDILLTRLWKAVPPPVSDSSPASWKAVASRTLPVESTRLQFGTRQAHAYNVAFTAQSPTDSCYIEALENGWLFLLPGDDRRGSLISVGSEAEPLLCQSDLIASQMRGIVAHTGSFNASPQMTFPLAGDRWLACGSAAVRFDPIAGEGAGHSIREGLLAAAVVNASMRGENNCDLAEHYSHRILHAFWRHLEECRKFYSVFESPWWTSEVALLDKGIAWCRDKSSSLSGSRFRLLDFDLIRC